MPDCNNHNEATRYIDTRSKDTPSRIRSECRDCGKFLGYRPVETKQPKRSKAK